MPAGQTPHTTIVYGHNDLVDKVQPGDRINITGEIPRRSAALANTSLTRLLFHRLLGDDLPQSKSPRRLSRPTNFPEYSVNIVSLAVLM